MSGAARERLLELCARHGLSEQYPPEVEQEVERLVADPGIEEAALTDLMELDFVTIDNEGSRDLDQAMFIAREGRGYRVDYALADAAHYVRAGTALFEEALRRGASYYLPGFSIPMLPRPLSEHLVSLNEGHDRRALVVRMHLDQEAEPAGRSIFQARVRSRRKLTYEGVQAYLDGRDASLARFSGTLDLLAEVGRKRLHAREARGLAEYDRLEIEVGVEEGGGRFTLSARPRLEVEKYNEQISLLCNMEGARFLRSGDHPHVQPIYRVHDGPPPSRVRDLAARIEELIRLRGLDPETWRWVPSKEDIGSYLARLPNAEDARTARAIHRQAVVINNPSRFSSEAGPHYGIGADEYSRFSSPMREIVGVYTHKEALEQLAGHGALDAELVARVVEAGNASKELQKRLDKEVLLLVLDQELRGDLGVPPNVRRELAGTVVGLSDRKLYVELDRPPLEVKVYLEDLGGDLQPTRDRAGLRRGSEVPFAVGDPVRLRVSRYDPGRRRWSFRMDLVS